MGFRVEDGKGRGYYASVDHDNRLEVASITLPLAADRSHEGLSFSLVGEHTLQASATEESVMYFRNGNSDKHMHLFSSTMCVEASNALTIRKYFESTYTSGGTSKTPVQLNRGSAKESGIVVYDNSSNNLVLGTTSQVKFFTARFGTTGTFQFGLSDAVILGPGDTIRITAEGTSGAKVSATMFIYETSDVG